MTGVSELPVWVISLPPCRAPKLPSPPSCPLNPPPPRPYGAFNSRVPSSTGDLGLTPLAPLTPATVLPTPSLWFFLVSSAGNEKVSSE